MPSLLDPNLDERFDELAAQLRATRPRASEELRERVSSLRPPEPEPPRVRLWSRRAAFVLVPALLVALVAALAIRGTGGGGVSGKAREGGDAATALEARPGTAQTDVQPGAPTPPPPSRGRAQDYRAELRVRVDDLSGATARAMRVAQSLGGYVVRADLDDPESLLVLRVPVTRVQEALARLTGLGEIVSQRFQIQDLQQDVNRRADAIAALRRTIAALAERLRDPGLTPEQRAELERRLENARTDLRARERQQDAVLRQARLARITLTLTTLEEEPSPPGEIETAVRDGLGALDDVVAVALYILIVGSPFLALAAAAVGFERRRRRRADERLLEGS